MEMTNNNDIRTHRRLRKAYTALLEKKNYKSITVKELTEYAEMSRAAFYLHFDSIENFSFECSQYLIRKITSQMIFWLSEGRDKLNENCRKRKLLIDENDRELFSYYVKQEIYYSDYSSFGVIAPIYYEFLSERFSVSTEELKNSSKLNFFIRAFSASIMDSIENYDSKRMIKELTYVFMIWDMLFPEYKL